MHKKEKIIQAIVEQGVLPLYFHPDQEISVAVLEVLYASGIRVVEYTNRGKQALKNFSILKKTCNKKFPDVILGLGTVLETKTALKAIGYGADFLVSPAYSKQLAKLSNDKNMLWIPGCLTPTELRQAQESGQELVKIFPANTVGAGFINAVKEVFPDLLFMPTGGINSGNIESWFRAGVSAVGMGGSLISRNQMEHREYEKIKSGVGAIIKQIAAIRSSLI